MADEDSPWPYALNSCRKTGLLSPEGQDTQRKRGRRSEGKVIERDMSREGEEATGKTWMPQGRRNESQ